MRLVLVLGVTCLLSSVVCLAGCAAGTAPNVRALRMYSREVPTPALMQQHVREMADALELVEQLLAQTPYQPGAPWVAALPFDAAKAERAKRQLGDERASFVTLQLLHVRTVLAEARAGSPTPSGSPGYPSVREAVASVIPAHAAQLAASTNLEREKNLARERELTRQLAETNRLHEELATGDPDPQELEEVEAVRAQLGEQLQQLRDELARASTPTEVSAATKTIILQDAIVVTSVALRLTAEAMSLATVVALEAAELSGNTSRLMRSAPDAADLVGALPDEARRIQLGLESAAAGLQASLQQLSQLRGVPSIDPMDTAGFAFDEGLVDDIVGMGLDSVHLDLRAGGEALFYSAFTDAEFSSGGGDTYDYTGRQTQLEFDVEPIILATANLSLEIDWSRWANAMKLDLGYATNRVYESGGQIESGSLASELGVSSTVSEALEAALAIAGVRAGVRTARFNHGTVRSVLIEDGSQLADAPLAFTMKQIDVGYDFASRGGPIVQSLALGFRYFDYTLPRILYELVNTTPDEETAAYVFSRETPPQSMRTRYYMVTFTTNLERRVTPHFFPYFGFDFAVGYGPTRYYFLRDPDGFDEPSNQEFTSSSSIGLGLAGNLGMRWQFGTPAANPNAYFDLRYHAQSLSSLFASQDEGDTVVDTGMIDFFHGPTASLGGTF